MATESCRALSELEEKTRMCDVPEITLSSEMVAWLMEAGLLKEDADVNDREKVEFDLKKNIQHEYNENGKLEDELEALEEKVGELGDQMEPARELQHYIQEIGRDLPPSQHCDPVHVDLPGCLRMLKQLHPQVPA